MWAVDTLDDILLLEMLPALLVLVGSSLLLGMHWPGMGVTVAIGAVVYIAVSVSLSLYYVAPAARLSNAQDTRIGAAMADAITCNPVVKSFGAEKREDYRLAKVLDKWHNRTSRTWTRATCNGTLQMFLLQGLRTLVLAYAVWMWWEGRATAGDMAFVLTSYFIVHGYLRDIGQHVRNLQCSANEMEEMVQFYSRPIGVVDRADARSIRVTRGEILYDRVTFCYGAQTEPLFRDFSLRIRAGERVGLVGHSGSGKTTFVKLLHRLYDVGGGRILLDEEGKSRNLRNRCARNWRWCRRIRSCFIGRLQRTLPTEGRMQPRRRSSGPLGLPMPMSSSFANRRAITRWSANAA
jgi:ATP-binding cassette subfamily B protein